MYASLLLVLPHLIKIILIKENWFLNVGSFNNLIIVNYYNNIYICFLSCDFMAEGLGEVVGILCTDIRPGIFLNERFVRIRGTDHLVIEDDIFERDNKKYVKAIRMLSEGGKVLVGINSGGSYENVVVSEGNLIYQ